MFLKNIFRPLYLFGLVFNSNSLYNNCCEKFLLSSSFARFTYSLCTRLFDQINSFLKSKITHTRRCIQSNTRVESHIPSNTFVRSTLLFTYFRLLFKSIYNNPCCLELLIFLQNQREIAGNAFHESIIDIKGNSVGEGIDDEVRTEGGQRTEGRLKRVCAGRKGRGGRREGR